MNQSNPARTNCTGVLRLLVNPWYAWEWQPFPKLKYCSRWGEDLASRISHLFSTLHSLQPFCSTTPRMQSPNHHRSPIINHRVSSKLMQLVLYVSWACSTHMEYSSPILGYTLQYRIHTLPCKGQRTTSNILRS